MFEKIGNWISENRDGIIRVSVLIVGTTLGLVLADKAAKGVERALNESIVEEVPSDQLETGSEPF